MRLTTNISQNNLCEIQRQSFIWRTMGERELFVSKSLRLIFPPQFLTVSISPPLLPLKLWLDFWPQTEGSAGSWRAWIDPFQDRDIRSREWYKKVQGGGTRGYEGNKSTCRASIRRIHPPGWSCPIKCLKCGRPALVRQSGSQDGLSPIFPEEVFVPWPTSPAPITEKLSTNSTFMFPYYYTNLYFQSWVGCCPYEEFDHQDCCSDHCFLVDISVGNPVLKIPLHLAVKKDNLTSV